MKLKSTLLVGMGETGCEVVRARTQIVKTNKNMKPVIYLFIGLFLCWLLPTQGLVEPVNYSTVLSSMQDRQEQLDRAKLDFQSYLGERLDGFLEINDNCPCDIAKLAKEENGDRKRLFELMAASFGTNTQSVGAEWAEKRNSRYVPGVLRQIRCSDGSITFWNGRPPSPCDNDVARVLTRQYAKIYSQPSPSGQIVRDNLPLYEAFGVVKKEKDAGGNLWYQVTEEYVPKQKPANWNPETLGWITEQDTIPWKRALVMRFTESIGRKPAIFFKTPENVLDIANKTKSERQAVLDSLYSDLEAGRINGSSGMVAVEPTVGREQQQMILYPVLDFYGTATDQVYIDGMFARILKITARTRGADENPSSIVKGKQPIDIIFVMDLTNSMRPYLEKLLSAMNRFVHEVEDQDIFFGFIGYQNKDQHDSFSEKELTSKVLSSVDFVKVLRGIEIQKMFVKSDGSFKSVMEGVNLALDSKQWRDKSAKFIFLIGDSPGREDVFTVKNLQEKSFTRKIQLLSFYIDKYRGAEKYSALGKKQYRELSVTWEGAYGASRKIEHNQIISDGSLADFESNLYSDFQEAKMAFDKLEAGVDMQTLKLNDALSSLIFQQAVLLLVDSSVPEKAITGWVADRVLNNPGREALVPAVMLNMHELDELKQRVAELIDIGEKALRGDAGTTLDFFDLVNRNTRLTMINPAAVNFRDVFSVPLGIDSLPYDSDIMAATREEFYNIERVENFIHSMKNKLRYYEDLERQKRNPYVWTKLSTGASERDRVVCVELNQLP